MGDIDCNFGDCDCDCDPDCCCCCCPDFDQCCDGCCSWDGDHSLCCCIICIGGDDGRRNHRDSNCLPWLCCWNYDSRRRTTAFSDDHSRPGPTQNGMKKEEKEKKKEPGSRQATYGTCYTCHGPIDISQRYRHRHDSSDYDQCSRCSSTPPYPFDPPPIIQHFHKLDHWRSGPKQNGMKKEEKEKKKEPGSRQATYGTCYTCHGPIDISQRYRHWHDSSDYQCSRCSSTPPYPLDPPASIQQFHKLDQESRVGREGMY